MISFDFPFSKQQNLFVLVSFVRKRRHCSVYSSNHSIVVRLEQLASLHVFDFSLSLDSRFDSVCKYRWLITSFYNFIYKEIFHLKCGNLFDRKNYIRICIFDKKKTKKENINIYILNN